MRLLRAALVAGACALAPGLLAADADAVILPAVTVDGPSQDIVGFGGIAMAEDGSGGIVYLKRVGGVAHVFVARYTGGEWQAPIQVDAGKPFAASWPRIGAAEGGELVVVWVTALGTENGRPVDQLLSATLGPGASAFGPTKVVDPDIGSGAAATPEVAMSTTGQADVVYRVVAESSGRPSPIPLLRPADVVEEVRLAHFEGETWSRLGAINRNPDASMRPPTPLNAPQVAIGPTGNAVVAWQEPDEAGVARIWARRVFGRTLDYVLPVTATSVSGRPISDDADAPSVAITRTGGAEVAYRQAAGPGSPLAGPRIFLNTLPDGESGDGTQFAGAAAADSVVSGGAAAVVGPPTIDADQNGGLRLLYDANGTPRVVEGNVITGTSAALSLGAPFAGAELGAASVMNPAGGGVSAWPSSNAAGPGVAVREDFPAGAIQTAVVRGGNGGPVADLAVGRSGLGDGFVGFLQGPLGDAAVVALRVTAPPAQFLVSVPRSWVGAAGAVVSWSAVPTADGPIRYALVRDGRVLPLPPGALQARLDGRGLSPGLHSIQVLATDASGEATLTPVRWLKVDDQPPSVSFTRRGNAVIVSIRDRFSGVNARSVKVSFGDGRHATGRTSLRHRYLRPGIYEVVVQAANRVGEEGVVRRPVKVR